MSNGRFSGINQRIADRLVSDGRLSRDNHYRAVEYSSRHKVRIEEALIDLEIMSEADLLKYIATVHNTRFVSTDKLSKAVIDPRLLARVPLRLVEIHNVFPVLFDDRSMTLSIVTADPDNDAALHELRLAVGVKDVRALVARPAAVLAAIALHYRKDRQAFAPLLRSIAMDLLNNDPFAKRGTQPGAPPPSPPPQAAPPPAPPTAQPANPARNATVNRMTAPQFTTGPQPPSAHQFPPKARSVPPPQLDPFASQPSVTQGYGHAAPAFTPALPIVSPGPAPTLSRPPSSPPPPPVAPALAPTTTPQFIETLNVLVSLLENSRADLRGHSSTVARLVRKTCERIGLNPQQINAFVAAAYLHDLGKMGAYHLTALNVSEYEGHRVAASKATDLPVHLMESVGLLPETSITISSMYERYDGQGIPNGQAGKDIPLGARILAVADTYADLTQNPRNPYRKILRPFEACDVLLQYRATIFDPNIVDLFRQSTTGEDMRAKLLSDRLTALILDPDPEETTVLELRLIEHGFEVKIARTAAQARKMLSEGEIAAVVSEIDLETPDAGLQLREALNKEGAVRDVTWVILTSRTDRLIAQRAFDLGVDDFVLKPVSTDIFAAKLRQLIERRGATTSSRGVSGSLAEMSLPDMVQILWHGRKTCALKISANSSNGEIGFAEGQVVDARWESLRGEEAFYKMLTLREGDFRLDPSFKPTVRAISASPEALLLEGMRRLDEASL